MFDVKFPLTVRGPRGFHAEENRELVDPFP
jgi:hypothetical protein